MSEAQDVFNARKKEAHIQLEEIKEFLQLCNEGKAFSGVEVQELEGLLEELENDKVEVSNDMGIDKIVIDVLRSTKDAKLIEVLKNLKVTNISDDSILGRAYPQYSDGTYYIEIGRNIDRKIRRLSELFGVLFMFNEKMERVESLVLCELLDVNILRFKQDEEWNAGYNEAQIKMMICDKVAVNHFTDKYVAYAREIYEMAIAFLVGHEIGHHYYGHTDWNDNSNEDGKIKELKADRYGMEFAFEYLKGAYASQNNRYGIHQFAGIYMPLIASSYMCDDIRKEEGKHPSMIKRLLGIQRWLGQLLDDEGYHEVQYCVHILCDVLDFQEKFV